MTMHVHFSPTGLQKPVDDLARLHLMPCQIKSDGEANVSKYFEPIITKQQDETLKASFRGYPLLGKEIELPKGYRGIILEETHEKMDEEAQRNFYATDVFDKFTYWNWDKAPTSNDRLISALQWIEIAQVIKSKSKEVEYRFWSAGQMLSKSALRYLELENTL